MVFFRASFVTRVYRYKGVASYRSHCFRGSFVLKNNRLIAFDLFDAIRISEQYISVWQYESVAGTTRVFPIHLAPFVDDRSLGPQNQVRMETVAYSVEAIVLGSFADDQYAIVPKTTPTSLEIRALEWQTT